ncbi:ATP-binding protein [Saccharothrix texasensis]|uniref:ATP-binding protein n=1 Tax=Saccharothrix texasensis TaxID=103734 RepID=UPI001FE5313C|nr:tetratricopeptide repeat protein [Saccharothrix texasensis]
MAFEPEPSRFPGSTSADVGDLGVRNTVSGVVGGVVQAGVVHGGVHLHTAQPTSAWVVPRQLPSAPALFVGRAVELDALDHALAAVAPNGRGTAVQAPTARGPSLAEFPVGDVATGVSTIGGAGGMGKTWLVLAWAHRHLDRFPDGQLFVDLHGFSPAREPMDPAVAVRGFLDALGVEPGRIPADPDAQVARYRSLVADRRMLIVLDNAATAEQVIPLLPGSSTCTVLVTGRTRLASLIDRHGARHLTLDILTRDEARALLTARLGTGRVAAEPDAVDELIALCGSYPLALSITARHAVTSPAVPLPEIAGELRESGLEVLDHDTDPAASLPAVLSWSLRRLTDEQRTVFALLGIAPGLDTTPPAAAALTGLAPARARMALSALVEASLVDRRPHGRYAMHDLIRDYATTTAHDLPHGARQAALARVMDFHLHTAATADHLLNTYHPFLPPAAPAPGVHPLPLSDTTTAAAWLEAEHATLLATQQAAAVLGRHHVVWHLAWALNNFHMRRGHLRDSLAAWRAALDAAVHLPDPATRSRAHRHLGRACARLGLHEESHEHLARALDLAVRHHDTVEQAHTHGVLAFFWGRQGDDRRALAHARHALGLYRAIGRPLWEADALNSVGWYCARLDELDTARDHCHAALSLHRRFHDADGEASTMDTFGLIAHRAGDHRQAIHHYHQALTRYRAFRNTYFLAYTLDNVGHPHAALGEHDQARTAWQEALEFYREQGRDIEARRLRQQLHDLDTLISPPESA